MQLLSFYIMEYYLLIQRFWNESTAASEEIQAAEIELCGYQLKVVC
jgi:hypothetical protein